MPKMIGWTPREVMAQASLTVVNLGEDRDLGPEAKSFLVTSTEKVTLGTLRAMARKGFVPESDVVAAVLRTTDKGGPGRLAKRWYSWHVARDAYQEYRRENPLRKR